MARSASDVVFVIGYAASGKSTFVKSIVRPGDVVIEPGDIVRELSNTERRVFDTRFDDAITKRINAAIDRAHGRVIVSSPRSLRILHDVIEHVGEENVKIYVLDVPYSVRKSRYDMRAAKKDAGMPYDVVVRADNKLGMGELMEWCSANRKKYDIEFVDW